MYKPKYIYMFFILLSNILYAQVELKGVVKDDVKNTLEMANIVAVNSKTKNIDSYGFTDAFGNYQLNLKANSSYIVKFSYIGMKDNEVKITVTNENVVRNIALEFDNTLGAVEIVAKMPVRIKGDTIIYNADSFMHGNEKKLEDVLDKLPGFDVDENGQVKVQGKKVKQIMVDGKKFFDGDTKLALKNIPANAIDKVEVLKNHSDVSQMSRVTNNEDNTVINIKLKAGKKNFWFGDVLASSAIAREDERYVVNPNLFYYSPKGTINLIGNFNNIGKVAFSRQDYYKFLGGIPKSGSESTSIGSVSSDLSSLTTSNDKAKEITSKFGALNFSYALSPKWDVSGFGIFSGNETKIEDNTENIYTAITSNENSSLARIKKEITSKKSIQTMNLGLMKLSSVYKLNDTNQFDYGIFGKLSNQNQSTNLLSVRNYFNSNRREVPIVEGSKQQPFEVNQTLNYYGTLKNSDIVTFAFQQEIQNHNPFYNAKLKYLSMSSTLGLQSQPVYDISQEKRLKTNKFDIKTSYYHILNRTSNLNVTFGSTLSNQKFNSSIFEILSNGTKNVLSNSNTKNAITYNVNDYFMDIHYRVLLGDYTLNQGVSFHEYNTNNIQRGASLQAKTYEFLPDVSVKRALSGSDTINFGYKQQVGFTDVNNLAEGFVFNNYSRLFSGNRYLESYKTHNINLSYFSFKMYNFTNIFATINYSRKINNVIKASVFNGIESIANVVQSDIPNEMISANARYGKKFRKFKINLGGGVNFSKFNNLLYSNVSKDYVNQASSSFNQNYNFRLQSNFKSNVDFSLGYKVNRNDYKNGFIENTFITHSPFATFEWYINKELNFDTKYVYNNYSNKNQTLNSYSFWDANLNYQRAESKIRYSIAVTNLLNTESINKNFSGSNFNSNSEFFVQPRFVMLSLAYEL